MKILMKINCIALRKKIIILLIVCVLVPMITTNSYIFLSVKRGFDREQQQELERMAGRADRADRTKTAGA